MVRAWTASSRSLIRSWNRYSDAGLRLQNLSLFDIMGESLRDKFSLFGSGRSALGDIQHMKDQLSCRRAGFNFFGQRLEIDTARPEFNCKMYEIT
jgi:hypothetical protein